MLANFLITLIQLRIMTSQQIEKSCLLILEQGSRSVGLDLRKRMKLSNAVIYTGSGHKNCSHVDFLPSPLTIRNSMRESPERPEFPSWLLHLTTLTMQLINFSNLYSPLL